MLPDLERVERIGEFWSYPQSRSFAELLIDAEEDRVVRAVLVGMLRELSRRATGPCAPRRSSALGGQASCRVPKPRHLRKGVGNDRIPPRNSARTRDVPQRDPDEPSGAGEYHIRLRLIVEVGELANDGPKVSVGRLDLERALAGS